jgi:hypothetical protein
VIRAVIDTNVLVSGLLSPTGNEALILLAVHQEATVPDDRLRPGKLTRMAIRYHPPRSSWPAEDDRRRLLRARRSSTVVAATR